MDLQKIRIGLEETAYKAGDFIRGEFSRFKADAIEYKSKNDLVSYVDKRAEEIIIQNLIKLDSSVGIIAEESHAQKGGIEGLNWIIDPLDGTVNFVHGIPHFAVSLALSDGLKILAGVVYHVMNDEMYVAVKGEGSYKNGVKIETSAVRHLEQSVVATGFPYNRFDHLSDYFIIFENLIKSTHGVRRFGSAALDLAFVAEGRYEAFFEYNLNSWDLAAGALLVEEAGGIVSDFYGNKEYLLNGSVIAGGKVQEDVLKTVMAFWGK